MAKMGRKLKPFDWELLDKILRYKPSLSDTAEIMKVSEDTVQNKIKDEHGITFSAYRDKKMANVRLTLVQKAIQMAMSGDRTLMIFSLKNYCGWADVPKDELAEMKKDSITLNYNFNEQITSLPDELKPDLGDDNGKSKKKTGRKTSKKLAKAKNR